MKKAHKNWVSIKTWTEAVEALARITQYTGLPTCEFILTQPKGCYDVLIVHSKDGTVAWAAGCSEFVDKELREAAEAKENK